MAQEHVRSDEKHPTATFQPLPSQASRRKIPRLTKLLTARDVSWRRAASTDVKDDRDELSDDEEEETGSTRWFSGNVLRVLKAVFPDTHPFRWMLLPYAVLCVIYLVDLGSTGSSRMMKLYVPELTEEIAKQARDEFPDHVPELSVPVSAVQFRNGGYLLFTLWATANVVLWLGFMAVRVLVIILLMNAVSQEKQIISALFTVVDPHVVYVTWSIATFGIWNGTFRQSVYSWEERATSDISVGAEKLYYSSVFRGNLRMTQGLLNISSTLWAATILLALRRLLVRVLMFRFELNFLMNTNGELVSYLTRYSLLRRLNTRNAYNASLAGKNRTSPGWIGRPQPLISPRLRGERSDAPDSPPTSQGVTSRNNSTPQWIATPSQKERTLPKFEGDSEHGSVFRFRTYLSRQALTRELYGHGLPRQLRQCSIDKSTRDPLHNWMLIQFALHTPPAFFLRGKRIELVSKTITRTVAENLFVSFAANTKSMENRESFESTTGYDTAAPQSHLSGNQNSNVRGLGEGGEAPGSSYTILTPSQEQPPKQTQKSLQPEAIEHTGLSDAAGGRSHAGVPNRSGLRVPGSLSLEQQRHIPGLTVSGDGPLATRAEDDTAVELARRSKRATFKTEAVQQQTPRQLALGSPEPSFFPISPVIGARSGGLPTWSREPATQSLAIMPVLQEVNLASCSAQRDGLVTTLFDGQNTGYDSHSIIQKTPASAAGTNVSYCSPEQCSEQQVSRSTSLAQGSEDMYTRVSRPVLRSSPILGALDYTVNSRLLANLGRGDVWCGEYIYASGQQGKEDQTAPNLVQAGGRDTMARSASRETEYFNKDFLDQFLKPEESAEFMRQVDVGGHGKISKSMFIRSFVSMYKFRSSLIKSLENQASISKTVRQMISVLLWAGTIVALLLVLGVDLNTVLVSGAAALSAMLVALSYLYEQFVTAVIFVALTNPYSVGDRVVVEGERVLFVRRIHTYSTEFNDIYGSLVVISNSILWGQKIVNESRSRNASLEFNVQVGFRTRLHQLRVLELRVKQALAARPLDFVKDSFCIFLGDVQPGRWIQVCIWMTTVESWTNWPKILRLRTEMSLMIHKFLMEIGIWYEEPKLPLQLKAS